MYYSCARRQLSRPCSLGVHKIDCTCDVHFDGERAITDDSPILEQHACCSGKSAGAVIRIDGAHRRIYSGDDIKKVHEPDSQLPLDRCDSPIEGEGQGSRVKGRSEAWAEGCHGCSIQYSSLRYRT